MKRLWSLAICTALLLCAVNARAQKSPEDLLDEINRLLANERQRRLDDGPRRTSSINSSLKRVIYSCYSMR
jgi:hypothetical protein